MCRAGAIRTDDNCIVLKVSELILSKNMWKLSSHISVEYKYLYSYFFLHIYHYGMCAQHEIILKHHAFQWDDMQF